MPLGWRLANWEPRARKPGRIRGDRLVQEANEALVLRENLEDEPRQRRVRAAVPRSKRLAEASNPASEARIESRHDSAPWTAKHEGEIAQAWASDP